MLNSLMNLNPNRERVETITTGLYSLDYLLKIGGIKKGSLVEVFGQDNTCKTSFILNTIQAVQKNDGICVFMDLDNSVDPLYMENIGITDDLIITKTETGEEVFSVIRALLNSGAVDLIIIDSIASLCPSKELENKIDINDISSQSDLIKKELLEISTLAEQKNIVIILTNHLKRRKNGNNFIWRTVSERYVKFFSSLRIKLSKVCNVNNGIMNTGCKINASIVKSPYSITNDSINFNVLYKNGISKEEDIINISLKLNIISRKGSWYYYNDQKIIQGKDEFIIFLQNNISFRYEIENKIKNLIYRR
jgi:recombination protein RecA